MPARAATRLQDGGRGDKRLVPPPAQKPGRVHMPQWGLSPRRFRASFSLEQSGQMMLWINRTSPQSLCLMTFRPKRRASRGRGQTEVGRGPCLTLAMRERCSCEVVCMAARGRDTNTSSRCVSSLAWRRGQLAACCGGTRRAPRCAGDTRCSETAYRETCRVCP